MSQPRERPMGPTAHARAATTYGRTRPAPRTARGSPPCPPPRRTAPPPAPPGPTSRRAADCRAAGPCRPPSPGRDRACCTPPSPRPPRSAAASRCGDADAARRGVRSATPSVAAPAAERRRPHEASVFPVVPVGRNSSRSSRSSSGPRPVTKLASTASRSLSESSTLRIRRRPDPPGPAHRSRRTTARPAPRDGALASSRVRMVITVVYARSPPRRSCTQPAVAGPSAFRSADRTRASSSPCPRRRGRCRCSPTSCLLLPPCFLPRFPRGHRIDARGPGRTP